MFVFIVMPWVLKVAKNSVASHVKVIDYLSEDEIHPIFHSQ
jgi:hypothetical protein